MADFDNFEISDQNDQAITLDEDPAAAFLAREQTELAGLEDDDAMVQPAPPVNDGFDTIVDDGQPGEDFAAPQPQENGPSDAYSAISQVDKQRQEPEKIKIWREEQSIRLEKKDAEEEEKKKVWQDAAKKELDDWYRHHAEQLSKTKDNNRAAEEAFIKERDEAVPGQDWERICRVCEFNPKNSKNTRDVSRLRSILLQLKQTPLVR